MVKKVLIIGICVLVIITILVAYYIIYSSFPTGRLIVMNSAVYNGELYQGLSVIDLKTNKRIIISRTGRYSYMDYCKKRNSVYAVSQEGNGDNAEIFEINLDRKETIPVKLKVKEGETRKYEYLRCVPNRNAISYSDNGNIYIYDFDTQNESILIKDDGGHFWNSNGTKVLYTSSNDMLIHEYDVITHKDKNLKINGYAPQYSTDEKYLVFFKREGNSSYTCVRRVSDSNEWSYKKNYVWEMHFNQDSSMLLMRQPNNSSVDQAIQQLVFWDYKNNEVKNLHITYRNNRQFLLIN